ncbi:MAG: hypothetical protein E6R08_01360 [Nevskiaceae bacterium]|nr:MAG: hypothetical protein E6R08_01360 [Nevskiaceae bacterium]
MQTIEQVKEGYRKAKEAGAFAHLMSASADTPSDAEVIAAANRLSGREFLTLDDVGGWLKDNAGIIGTIGGGAVGAIAGGGVPGAMAGATAGGALGGWIQGAGEGDPAPATPPTTPPALPAGNQGAQTGTVYDLRVKIIPRQSVFVTVCAP